MLHARRHFWLQGDGTIVESPRVAGRHVRVPRAGALDDSLCHSPAGSASPNRSAHGEAPPSTSLMLTATVHQVVSARHVLVVCQVLKL